VNKLELEALLARIDIWLLVFGVVVVIGVAGESYFGIRHWWNSRKLQVLQNTENLAQQGEIERLKKESAGIRSDTARALERAAHAEQKAAESNRIAEEERLARIKIEEKLAPRQITSEQQAKLSLKLKPLIGKKVDITILSGNPETDKFGHSLVSALRAAGLLVDFGPAVIAGSVPAGLSLSFGSNRSRDAQILADALIEAGLASKPIFVEKSSSADVLGITVAPRL